MHKVILGLFFFSCLIGISGCQTMKNTAIGVCGLGKGIAVDAGNAWKAIDKADKWFKENCW